MLLKDKIRNIMIFFLLLSVISCDPFHTGFDDVEDAVVRNSQKIVKATEGDSLKVVTWNIKFAGGRIDFFFDCYGDRVLMTKDEVLSNLDGLAKKIKELDPDIILLQEIDLPSKRSAYIDQVQYLLDHTDLNYGVYASQWKSDFVPSDGIGRIDTGSAILSKYKLKNGKRIALPLISEQDSATQYFYLKRNILTTEINYKNKNLVILATHTSAYATDGTKLDQINIFKQKLLDLDKSNKIFIAGGDLNTVPPETVKFKEFDDDKCEGEYEDEGYEKELDILNEYYSKFKTAISLDEYKKDNSKYFTHTTNKKGFWNRKLDYLFTNGDFQNGKTIQDGTMPLSDHAPISVEFKF